MRTEKLDRAWKWFITAVCRPRSTGLEPVSHLQHGGNTERAAGDALLLPGGYDVQSYYLKEGHVMSISQRMRSRWIIWNFR